MPDPDILIVGGGLIGLGIGWELARAGRSVTVIERDTADADRPAAASWAAAGMLAPLMESGFGEREQALTALGRASLALYPEWVAALEIASGMGVDYRTEGTLVAALDADDAAWLRREWEFQQAMHFPTEWLSGAAAREREPHLAPGVTAAVFSPGDHQVDNRRMWNALRTAFSAAGGVFRPGVEAVGIEHSAGRARGAWVRPADSPDADAELWPAEQVVVCAGAWSRLLLAELPRAAIPPIRPVKGQMLALEMSPLVTLGLVIRTRRVYLAPKAGGRLVVGATSEEAGFDTRLTAGGLLELLRDAWEVVPGVYDLPVLQSWAGLRPASRDHSPVLGPTPIEGLFVAVGHYRNGVLLTPITATAMRDLLLGERVPELVRPFGLERFHRRPANPQ